jgi:hypothetical protein
LLPKAKAGRATAKIAVTGYGFAVGAWRAACQQHRPLVRPLSPIALSPDLDIDVGGRCRLGNRAERSANGTTAENGSSDRPKTAAADQRRGAAAQAETARTKTRRSRVVISAGADRRAALTVRRDRNAAQR